MLLNAFTVFHVALSLIGIGAGVVVTYALIRARTVPGWTRLFLATTMATSVTGFFFPFHGFTPALALGVMSLIVLLIANLALYRHRLLGAWRTTYAITAVIALYFNVFVLVVQLFRRVPVLMALAPTQSEPPFHITKLAVLLLFAALGIRAATKNAQRAIPPN